MAKKAVATGSRLTNRPLERFLLELSVDGGLRKRFTDANEEEKRALLKSPPFKVGDNTIAAVLSGDPGKVRVRFRFSDQQGTNAIRPRRPGNSRTKASKKR